jgi:DNA-binding NarL/FixJ family response regulator
VPVRILIVEDEPIIAADIEQTLTREQYQVIGVAHSSTKAIDMLHRLDPDLVLLDIAIRGDRDGIDIARIAREQYEKPFIYITSFADRDTLERAKSTLPSGYIVKPFKDRDIISAIEMALYRHSSLADRAFPGYDEIQKWVAMTPGEYHVMKEVWAGKSNQQVAEELSISINTIKTHLKSIFSKLQVSSRSEAIAVIRQHKKS